MKYLSGAITGTLSMVLSYGAVLFTGVSISYLLGYEYQASQILNLGLRLLVYNVGAGIMGGIIGGNGRGFNGALIGGIVVGVLAAAARILYVFFV